MFILRGVSATSQRIYNTITNRKMVTLQHEVDTPFEKATFGMGCFWSCDSLFGAQQGVLRTCVGYSGGTKQSPTYRDLGDHTEVIDIDFDPKIISYNDLLDLFWKNHEYGLTTKIKKQYMSLVLYHNENQKTTAEKSREEQRSKNKEPLRTEIQEAGQFYPAEDYHQKYRLQGHSWICEQIGLNPKLLHKSHIAARLNGYLTGLGKEEQVLEDMKKFGFDEKMVEYVRKHWKKNEGGVLFC